MIEKSLNLMPKLRFSEFRDAGEWHFQPLSNIVDPISDRVGKTNCVPMSVTTGIGLVSQEEKFGRTIAGDSYKNYIRLQANDFAYNKSATKEFPQGYIARYHGMADAAVPKSIFTCFRPNIAAIIPEYLDHLFHKNHHGQWLQKYIMVGARAHGALSVSDDDLMSMPVPLPPDAVSCSEQQKIADCLDSLDDLIAAEGKKLEALRQHKQGLMQQLFPQPGETVPKLRFPEFIDDPPWECCPLMNLAKLITQRNTHGTDLRALTNSAEHGVIDQVDYFDKKIATNTNNYFIVEAGDYVYNPRSSSSAPVGPISKNRIGVGVMSPLYTIFRFRSDANDFYAHYFRSSHWHEYLRRVSNHGARHDRMAIAKNDLMRMPMPTPTQCEQQKIADCLGSLDDLITAEGQKLEALRQHKQGLMQQLFPSLEQG